jgi:hypothetical protein
VSDVWWLLVLAVIVLVGVLEQRNDRLRDEGAYTMSRTMKRRLMRDRARLNPEMNPVRWRLG